jgi:hypothetical protein
VALALAAALASAAIFFESARLGILFFAAALAASMDSGVDRYLAISDSSKTDRDELSSHPINTSAKAGATQNILNFLVIVELSMEQVGE